MAMLPRLGKIKIGEKQGNRPVSLNHFTTPIIASNNTVNGEEIIKSFVAQYGENPTVLDIKLPSDDINVFMPRSLKRYVKSNLCICKSKIFIDENGKEKYSGQAIFTDPYTKEVKQIPCDPNTCEHFQKGNCKKVSDLFFFLPKVKGFGVWQISTRAVTSMRNIQNMTQFIKEQTGGKIAHLPLKLAIVKNSVPRKDNGKTINQEVNALTIDLGNMTIDQLLQYALKLNPNPIPSTSSINEEPIQKEKDSNNIPISHTTQKKIKKALLITQLPPEYGKKLMQEHFGVDNSNELTEKQGQELVQLILNSKTNKESAVN